MYNHTTTQTTPEFDEALENALKTLDELSFLAFQCRQFLKHNKYNHYKTVTVYLDKADTQMNRLAGLIEPLQQHAPRY